MIAFSSLDPLAPDGVRAIQPNRRLAFTYFHLDDCVDPYCDMSDVIKGFYSVPASGGRPKHIGLDNGSLVGEARPVPSPDGRSVAMLRAASGCPELRVRSGHGRWRVLARGRTKVGRDYRCTLRGFDWAPDSRRLLYVTERPAESNLQAPAGSVTSIWSIRADGRATRRVIELRDASISSAVWSPSGARIAYAATSVTDPDGIYVVARRGGHRRFLAEGAAPTWGVRPARRSSASAARLR